MALPIAGPGPRNGHVYLQDYAKKKWDCVPIAVPSKGREEQLCEQTLTMLKHHGYDMSLVHVFVDGDRQREDGSAEYDRYWKKLRAEGFGMVGLHPGGKDLRGQYARIFQFFHDIPEVVLTTDMVPSIVVRKRIGSVAVEPLEQGLLTTLIRVGFDVCSSEGARAWSFASCKAGMNLIPGNISRKCGLLCGNFHGIRMSLGPPPSIEVSNYTTDVEFSLRCWTECEAMVRFLGIAASHAYRSRGGLSMTASSPSARHKETCDAVQKLAKEFPQLLRTETKQKRRFSRMNYHFLQKGPKPMKFYGTFETRGRKVLKGWRPMTVKQRVAKHRLHKKPAKK